MKRFGIGFAALLGVVLLAAGGRAAAEAPALPRGVLVNVGERFVHLRCTGFGAPVVLLEAGLGGTSLEWAHVQAQVSTFTQVCSYDRAGYGWSDPAPAARTSAAIAEDLHEALTRARIRGPYVLVGHSVGGLHVRVFADRYPAETAALVLVDASHEHQVEAFRTSAAHLNTAPGRTFVVHSRPNVPANMPAGLQAEAQLLMSRIAAQSTLRRELTAFQSSAEQAYRARLPADMPLVVVSRGKRVWENDERGNAREAVWMELQRRLARMSRNSVHMIASGSGHHIHLDEPDVVTAAIRDAVARSAARFGP